jgi:hypothetical protein
LTLNPDELIMSCKGDMSMTKEDIQAKFDTDNRWLFKGILAVYARQTADERVTESVKYHNRKGFCPTDAKFLCSIGRQITMGWGLSPKQVALARKKMQKYAGQCLLISKTGERTPIDERKLAISLELTMRKLRLASPELA